MLFVRIYVLTSVSSRQGVQRRLVLVVNFSVFLKLLFFALLLLDWT